MTSHDVLGVRVDDVSADEVRALFSRWLAEEGQHVVVTPNPEFILLARTSERFRQLLHAADLALPDGTGLRFATLALTGSPLRNRMTGVAALQMLRSLTSRVVTLGNDVADVDAGVVADHLTPEVIERVRALQPEVVAVGLGQGKQEEIIARHRAAWPSAKILIGVGGAIEMVAGRQRRAPVWLQHAGLEWIWRLATQPRRWRRILRATLVFPAVVVWTTLQERRFLHACRSTIPEIFRQLLGR